MSALERSISIAAFEIMKSFAVIAVENRYKNIFIDQLVTQRGRTLLDSTERAKLFGWNLVPPFCSIVIDFSSENAQDRSKADYLFSDRIFYNVSQAVGSISSKIAVAEKAGHIMVILAGEFAANEQNRNSFVNQLNTKLRVILENKSFMVGIGNIYQTADGISDSYDEARKAITISNKQDKNSSLSYYDKLGIWKLLGLLEDRTGIEYYIKDILGELIEYDKKYNTQYLITIEKYLLFNLSIKHTASYFELHYNTIKYRLDQIKRLFNIDLKDQMQRLSVEVAVQLNDKCGM
jgi:PucR family transcriptional regulator, purine catabolism regulatory protein